MDEYLGIRKIKYVKYSSIISRSRFLLDVERVNINDPLVWPLEA